MRKNRFKGTGNKGIIAGWITDKVIAIKLWKAIIIIIMMCAGVVCLVTYLLNSIERITLNRVNSGIVHGIKSPQGKFWIADNISIIPQKNNTGKIVIAGTGAEGPVKTWEGR